MELAVRRPMRTAAALTTAGALALAPITVTPEMHALELSPATVSTQAVQLTDAWSDLLTNTVANVVQLGALFIGLNSTFPLPNPVFIAPVATQLVLNPLIYAADLVTGHGADIPAEILSHINNVVTLGQAIVSDVIPAIGKQIQTPFLALQLAIDSVATATNKLVALLEAPAVFLDAALNSQFGLIGVNGPIAVPIIIRNLLASAIAATPPTIVLPFKKASGAAAKTVAPKAAAVSAPSGTAGSARSKPKPPSSSNRKATSAKASTKSGAHSKRG
ncbi:hypothetical protein MycrhDRAFT_0845 [Mycolicibacterium rhodesiae JS60]|nr:hypothetical protein MycrhDRAFT_0845 [Mycolicibacterium rhodesiae JS60]